MNADVSADDLWKVYSFPRMADEQLVTAGEGSHPLSCRERIGVLGCSKSTAEFRPRRRLRLAGSDLSGLPGRLVGDRRFCEIPLRKSLRGSYGLSLNSAPAWP